MIRRLVAEGALGFQVGMQDEVARRDAMAGQAGSDLAPVLLHQPQPSGLCRPPNKVMAPHTGT